jgi:hypothetical protein
LYLGAVRPHVQLRDGCFAPWSDFVDAGAANAAGDAGRNTAQSGINGSQRGVAIRDGQIGEIKVHRNARQVPHEQIDRRAAFESKGFFHGDKGHDADQQSGLTAVKFSDRHQGPPARLC